MLILAHGAGADQRHRFMIAFAEGLAARGVEVVTFNFPYTEAKRGAPDKPPVLEACWRDVIAAVRPSLAGRKLAIGGKSMGGRIASMVASMGAAAQPVADALVFLGYPLHPPKRPAELRAKHLPKIAAPMLFVQGTRDPFGGPDELRPILTGLDATLHEIAGGDHSFAVLEKSGRTEAEVFAEAQEAIVRFLRAQ